jgi:hypothetical protein
MKTKNHSLKVNVLKQKRKAFDLAFLYVNEN